ADPTLALTAGEAVASGLKLQVVNPRAPGHVKGVIVDTLGDDRGLLRLISVSTRDSTRRLLYDIDASGKFDLTWDPGTFRVRAFRDLDKNRAWKRDEEPASEEIEITVKPGGMSEVGKLVLVRPPKPSGPSAQHAD